MPPSKAKNIMIGVLDFTKKEAIQLAMDIHGRLVEETPKDTGWAASNWVPQIGSRYSSTVGSPEGIDTSQQVAGMAQLAGWDIKKGPAFISNNVEYIQALNAGHSQQAPAMFVEKIVQSEVAKARSGRGIVRRALGGIRTFFFG